MRLLLINFDTEHATDRPDETPGARPLGQLEALCRKHELDIRPADAVAGVDVHGYDAVLLAGGYREQARSADWYQAAIELVQLGTQPVLGIGLGFEIICTAFGADLAGSGELAPGASVITPTEDGAKTFQGTDPLRVAEAARWLVEREDVPKILQVLATSETGVEAVKHKTLPVYGIQLYPEDFSYPSDGKLVYENILAAMRRTSSAKAAA